MAKDLKKRNDDYTLPSTVLLFLGIYDLLRGFLHTFEVSWAANTFAKLDLSCVRDDQLQLLGAFGISNILTGVIYILISRKAKNLSPSILITIPIAYAIGRLGLGMSGINPTASFLGKYLLLLYFVICIVTWVIYILRSRK